MIPFVHLHVHSEYSLLDGQASIPRLVDKAIADGMKGLALTDHGNMFGIKEFANYVAKANKKLDEDKKLKPILGCEMYVARNKMTDIGDKTDKGYHLIVLAKNKTGYHNLVKLVSEAWKNGYYYHARTDKESLAKYREGLIVASACLGGEIPQLILNNDLEGAEKQILWYKEVFGEDYYLELQRHKTDKPNSNRDVYPEQQRVNPFLIEMSKKHGIKLIATNDSHFVDEDDAEAHDRLICINVGKRFGDPTRMHYTKQEWLKTQKEMFDIFSDIPEALENTQEIVDKVEFYSIDSAPIMPTFDIPEDFGTEEEYRKKITEQELFEEFTRDENGNVVLTPEEAEKKISNLGGYEKLYRIKLEADYLAKLTHDGAIKRYGTPLSQEVEERLNFELHIMKTMGFPGYFLIVQDFINAARRDLGVSVGPGRGSAAGSAAAYCLGITDIDPIKYDLLFERFLNPDRISLPDIDVDFDDDGRYAVLNYVTEKYGAEKVAHIITYGTMATKMAIKDVAKIHELPLPEANRLAKLVPDRLAAGKVNFENCLKYVPEFAREMNNPNPLISQVLTYAQKLEGTVRNTGVHACGVIICRDDITDWVPVSTATDTDGSKVLVTQYEGKVIEETGLIKMDFLGLKTLSIIKEALENIKLSRGIDLDPSTFPLDDAATYKLYCEGKTVGTFQFESAGMQKYLRELQPSKFEDLIAMNALYRPGPMDYIPQFIARKHGEEKIEYDIPIMEKYLHDTYGITVYQEQVMLLSRLLADFTRGESDVLRKAMGKKQIAKMQELKVKFLEGGTKNGHKEKTLEKIWADWEKFASYAFNKSHATCYSWVAYQTAYLKANYPAEYMAGVLSRNLNNISKLAVFMDECKSLKIPVKGPDINESEEKFSVTPKGEIRFGLGAIKSLGSNTVAAILAERKNNGPFKDIFDFVERINPSACNRSAIDALAFSGAFDCFSDISREMFAPVPQGEQSFSEILVRYGQRYQADKNSSQGSLFGDFEEIETEHPAYPNYTEWAPIQLLDEEKKLVGMYLSAHPLDPYYMEIEYGCNVHCADFIDAQVEGAEIIMGGLVTGLQERMTKKGQPWGLLTVEDFSGTADVHLFGDSYLEYKKYGVAGTPVIIHANVSTSRFNREKLNLNIKSINLLTENSQSMIKDITITLPDNYSNQATFKRVKELMDCDVPYKGTLFFELIDPKSALKITLQSKTPVAITRELVNLLEENDISFRINSHNDNG